MSHKRQLPYEELYELYINQRLSKCQLVKHFKCNERCLNRNLIDYGIKKSKEQMYKDRSYVNPTASKYGSDNPNYVKRPEKEFFISKTIQEVADALNVSRPLASKMFKEYSVKPVIKRVKTTRHVRCSENFGQRCSTPEMMEKKRKILMERYGVDNPSKIYEVNKKKAKKEYFDVLKQKDKLEEFIKTNSIKTTKELSEALNYSSSQVLIALHDSGLYNDINFQKSYYEQEIYDFLKKNNIEFIKNDRKTIFPLELDFYIPSKKIAIEFNGNYWHSEEQKEKKYHINKTKLCEEKGIRLIHIWEYEFMNKKEKILRFLSSILLPRKTIFARKCVIKEVNKQEAKDFLEYNHLQGRDFSSVKLGLYYKEELVLLMTFCKPRFNHSYEWELSRLCTLSGCSVIGGASKLLTYFKKEYQPENIISYQDIAKFNGNIYEKLGFTLSHISDPNYVWWKKDDKILTRYQCQMKNEVNVMQEKGYRRIFDCGNKVWRLECIQ